MQELICGYMEPVSLPDNVDRSSIKVVSYKRDSLYSDSQIPIPDVTPTWSTPLVGVEFYIGHLRTGRGGTIELRYNKVENLIIVRGPYQTTISFELIESKE